MNILKEEAISSGSMNNTTYLNGFGLEDIKHEALINNQHSIAELLEPFILRDCAKNGFKASWEIDVSNLSSWESAAAGLSFLIYSKISIKSLSAVLKERIS